MESRERFEGEKGREPTPRLVRNTAPWSCDGCSIRQPLFSEGWKVGDEMYCLECGRQD